MGVRFGIDLGTTYSAISWYDELRGDVEEISLDSVDQGGNLLPSVVYYEPGGNVVVGDAAANVGPQEEERVIRNIKRSMGTDWVREIDGVEYTAPDVSAEILKTLAGDAQKALNEPVREVVVTVPAYFGDAERAATREAVKLADLELIDLLPEPVAAALAFAIERVDDLDGKGLIVYDLGGGTFDVTLLTADIQRENELITIDPNIVAKKGDRKLGGLDWNRVLQEGVADRVVMEHNYDPRDDDADFQTLRERIEEGKKTLSGREAVTIAADLMGHQVEISRGDFEMQTRSLLEQTEEMMNEVLQKADAGAKDDERLKRENLEVLLCGGSTRMPAVRELVERIMDKEPLTHGNPELLVTTGAAYWAYLTGTGVVGEGDEAEGEGEAEGPVVLGETRDEDNNRVATGIQLQTEGPVDIGQAVGVKEVTNAEQVERDGAEPEWACREVIPEDSPFGEFYEETFEVAFENMNEIPIEIYEGAERSLEGREPLAKVMIQTAAPKGTPVHVRLKYDEDGVITGEAEAHVRDEQGNVAIQNEDIRIERRGSRDQNISAEEQGISESAE